MIESFNFTDKVPSFPLFQLFLKYIFLETCKDAQCGETNGMAHGTCSGTVDSYTCVCDAQFTIPYRLSSIGLSSFCEGKIIYYDIKGYVNKNIRNKYSFDW